MKKSELRQIIREEIRKVIAEDIGADVPKMLKAWKRARPVVSRLLNGTPELDRYFRGLELAYKKGDQNKIDKFVELAMDHIGYLDTTHFDAPGSDTNKWNKAISPVSVAAGWK